MQNSMVYLVFLPMSSFTVGNPYAAYCTLCCVLAHFWIHTEMQQAVFSIYLSFILLNSVSVSDMHHYFIS